MGTKVIAESGTIVRVESGGRVSLNTVPAASFSAISVNGTTSNTRVGSWGAPGIPSIDMEVEYDFGTVDDAKIFFDTDNQLRLDLSQPTGTTQDNDWNAALGTRLGQVQMIAESTSSTGSSGLSTTIGYVDLTSTYQTIIDGTNIGSGTYAANDVLIEAQILSGGSIVKLRVTLTDQHTNAFFDSVGGGALASFTVLKASIPKGIVTPTNTVTNSF